MLKNNNNNNNSNTSTLPRGSCYGGLKIEKRTPVEFPKNTDGNGPMPTRTMTKCDERQTRYLQRDADSLKVIGHVVRHADDDER